MPLGLNQLTYLDYESELRKASHRTGYNLSDGRTDSAAFLLSYDSRMILLHRLTVWTQCYINGQRRGNGKHCLVSSEFRLLILIHLHPCERNCLGKHGKEQQ